MSITDPEKDKITALLIQAISNLKTTMQTMPTEEAREYFILAMVLMGFNKSEDWQYIIESDIQLTELFLDQTIH
jgi:hypothetical protein